MSFEGGVGLPCVLSTECRGCEALRSFHLAANAKLSRGDPAARHRVVVFRTNLAEIETGTRIRRIFHLSMSLVLVSNLKRSVVTSPASAASRRAAISTALRRGPPLAPGQCGRRVCIPRCRGRGRRANFRDDLEDPAERVAVLFCFIDGGDHRGLGFVVGAVERGILRYRADLLPGLFDRRFGNAAKLHDVAANFDTESRKKLLRDCTTSDASSGLAGRRSFENVRRSVSISVAGRSA